MNSKTIIGLIVSGCLAVGVAVYVIPKTPATGGNATTEIDIKINKAVALVQGGENPMQGIMLLREVLQEQPENLEAHYQLGMFSIQSNQLDKAVERLELVTSKNDEKYADAWFYLGQAYAGLNENEKAVVAYQKYKATTADEQVQARVDMLIKQLSN